jgi:hypothetical protein
MSMKRNRCDYLILVGVLFSQLTVFGQWNYVGSPAISDGWTTNNQIACLENGTPVIAYTRQNTAYCKIWNTNEWEALGAELSMVNAGVVYDLQVDALDRVVVGFEDVVAEAPNMVRYNGNDWLPVGLSSLYDGFVSEFVMAIDSNQAVWCALVTPVGFKLFKEVSGDWQLQNTTGLPTNFGLIDITFDKEGYLLMAFTDVNQLKGNVMRLNSGEWEFVGSPNYTSGFAQNNRIKVSNDGVVYHGFDIDQIYLNNYNTVSNSWEQAILPGFGAGITGIWDLKTDHQNNLFLSTSQTAGDKARCFRINDSFWEQLDVTGVSDGVAGYPEVGVNNNQLYFTYNDFDLSAASVKKFSGTLQVDSKESVVHVVSYPNPFDEFVSIQLNCDKVHKANVKVFSMLGEVVGQWEFSGTHFTLNLSIESGVYLLVIQFGDTFVSKSIVKL